MSDVKPDSSLSVKFPSKPSTHFINSEGTKG